MKIYEYYRDTANLYLNSSIAALVPSIIIVAGNLTYFHNKQIMLLVIPFLIYSFISFQLYLFRIKQSISIARNMPNTENLYHSLFETEHLLVVYANTYTSRLFLFYPDGHQAGMISKYRGKRFNLFRLEKIYALYNRHNQVIGYFKITRNRILKIEVYSQDKEYLGCLEKKKRNTTKENQEVFNESGRFVAAVEGSPYFMDEKIIDLTGKQVVRLRRGWMPLEWSDRFPEANTPVLSISQELTEQDKLLRIAFLINEFFIER